MRNAPEVVREIRVDDVWMATEQQLLVRLCSWTAAFVRVMVLAHFSDFASSPQTNYVRFNSLRSLMGPRVRAAEVLLAPIACVPVPVPEPN